DYSDSVAAEIDSEIRNIIEDAFVKAEDILTTHMDKLHTVAKYLMIYEKVDGETFEKLMTGELTEEDFTPHDEKENETESSENNSEEQ
ncbi:MAG: ATP-dependent zinc metalloprotease FtsH, partial [Oscillospiraceae bacterium]